MPGWGDFFGWLGRIGNEITDPVKRLDRKIDALEEEKERLQNDEWEVSKGQRISVIVGELKRLRQERDRALRAR